MARRSVRRIRFMAARWRGRVPCMNWLDIWTRRVVRGRFEWTFVRRIRALAAPRVPVLGDTRYSGGCDPSSGRRRLSPDVRRSLCIAAVLSLPCASTAQASVTLGQTSGATDNCSSDQVYVQAATAGAPSYAATTAGVVVSWSYLSHASVPAIRFKVYKPTAAAGTFFLRSQSALKSAGSGA